VTAIKLIGHRANLLQPKLCKSSERPYQFTLLKMSYTMQSLIIGF